MTHRERALAAIAHQPTDRAPANYSAHPDVKERMLRDTGVRDYDQLLDMLGVDFRRVTFGYEQPPSARDTGGYVTSMWGVRYDDRRPVGDPARLIPPFDENSTLEDVESFAWPNPDALDYSGVYDDVARYRDDYVVFGGPWCPFFHEVGWALGQEDFYAGMLTCPEVTQAIIDRFVDYEVGVLERYLTAARGKLDIYFMGNDFGTQRGLFISPAAWHRFFRKPLARFFSMALDFGCIPMKHSCGAVRDILPALIEDGVRIVDPIQVRADGMEFGALYRDFGHTLTLHGSIDTQHTLPFGSEQDVREQVRHRRDLTRAGGGFVLTGSQDFISDIPTRNILAMYDENLRYT